VKQNCFISVLFQFHFTCASHLRQPINGLPPTSDTAQCAYSSIQMIGLAGKRTGWQTTGQHHWDKWVTNVKLTGQENT